MPTVKQQTVREWADANPGQFLDGLVLRVPAPYREHLPAGKTKMAFRSAWAMGNNHRGLWVAEPGQKQGRVYPIFDVPAEDFFDWEIVAR